MEFPPPALAEVAEQVEVVETIYAQKPFGNLKNMAGKDEKQRKTLFFLHL